MKCDHSQCTGVHGGNRPRSEWCQTAIQRQRVSDARYDRSERDSQTSKKGEELDETTFSAPKRVYLCSEFVLESVPAGHSGSHIQGECLLPRKRYLAAFRWPGIFDLPASLPLQVELIGRNLHDFRIVSTSALVHFPNQLVSFPRWNIRLLAVVAV